MGQERLGTAWTGHQSVVDFTWRDKFTIYARINTYSQFRNANYGFEPWEEVGVPCENPRRHGDNMQMPHRKASVGTWIQICREVAALTTTPRNLLI